MRIRYQFLLIQAIRDFFNARGFLDVLTPPMVENPGMEPHIHPFQVMSARGEKHLSFYLHTSPEFAMKKLLSLKEESFHKIFQLSYCFRDEPRSPEHRPQFIMLEWYRCFETYEQIKKDTQELILFCHDYLKKKQAPVKNSPKKFETVTVDELFQEYLQFSILDYLNPKDLREKIEKDLKDLPLPAVELAWEDYFFFIFLNKIEPFLKNHEALFVDQYPAPLAALSQLNTNDPRVCDRFELYLNGVELANCFQELTSYDKQKKRFLEFQKSKRSHYQYQLPWPEDFMQTLERGLPPSCGIALGVERLLMSLCTVESPWFE